MKKFFLLLSFFSFVVQACDMTVLTAPSTSTVSLPASTMILASETSIQIPITATLIPAISHPSNFPATATYLPTAGMPTMQPLSSDNTVVTFRPLTISIPSSVSNGASGKEYPRFDRDDAAYWQKTPGHLQVTLSDYYVLQGKFHQPQIYVYPAQAYAEMVPAAFESMRRINDILADPSRASNIELLPSIPFLNALQAFASNVKLLQFQNGNGIRFITQYAQYPAPINNHELFYHFQGLTRGGQYYIVAIFPISAPLLAETADSDTAIPFGGVEYRGMGDPSADFPSYYASITDLLNATPNDAFTPSINQLDLLIQSIDIVL